MIFYIVNCWLN